jgi:phosphoribosylglycinamide formyltransferase-1
MMNLVTGDLDRGPAISFCRFPIHDADNTALWEISLTGRDTTTILETPLYADIRARGVARERPFLVETLRGVSSGAIAIPPPQPVDLTAAVEAAFAPE